MKILSKSLIPLLLYLFLTGCTSPAQGDQPLMKISDYGQSRFFIISDIHFLSDGLFDDGTAFQRHLLYKKGNLTEYGQEILTAFQEQVSEEIPDFILVSGDLTNNGERKSHLELASYFSALEKEGVDVFVIPGNHDINYPFPLRFSGDSAIKAEPLNAGEFLSLYGDFGYGEAFSRDLYSLSYAVNISSSTLLIGLDSCRYGEGYGSINRETMTWLRTILEQGYSQGQSVLLFMHHSLLEHFPGQDQEKEMRLRNRGELISLLQQYGVQVLFTGHYHAQDIAVSGEGMDAIFDIETGSLISWPFAYREVICDGPEITLKERFVKNPFLEDKGWQLSYNRIYRFSDNFLSRYGVRTDDRKKIADYVSRILLNHYGGDEDKAILPEYPSGLSLRGQMAMFFGRKYYDGRQYDKEPPDGNIRIDTLTGTWYPLP